MATLNKDNTNARMRHKLHPSSFPQTPKPSRQHRVPKYKKRWEAKVKELEAKEKEVQKLKQLVMQLQEAHDIVYVQDTFCRSLPPQLHSTASRGKDTCVAVALGDLWFTVVCCCAVCVCGWLDNTTKQEAKERKKAKRLQR